MVTNNLRLLFVAMLSAVLSPALHAAPVLWHLNGVTFSDGSHAVGSFVYDTTTGLYTNINIVTTPGTGNSTATAKVTDARYTVASPFAGPAVVVIWTSPNPITGVTGILQWGFAGTLAQGGGTVPLALAVPGQEGSGSYQGLCLNPTCEYAAADSIITIIAGSVTADLRNGPRTWYLDNVTFDDGGLATGSFVYDAIANTYSQVDITVTSGTTFPGTFHYGLPGVSPAPGAFANAVRAFGTLPTQQNDRYFNGNFASALTNDGGTIAFNFNAKEVTCDSPDCIISGINKSRAITFGSVTTIPPVGFTKVLSQIVDGGGWQTTLMLTNLSRYAQAFTVSYWQDDGTPWAIPGEAASQALTVPGNGVVLLNSAGTGSDVNQGWAKIQGTEAYSVMGIFKIHGDPLDQQAAVTGDNTGGLGFSMPFDESKGAAVGLALANPSASQAQTVLIIAYDANGKVILNDSSLVLQPLQHIAFDLDQKFPVLLNQQGKIRVFGLPVGAGQLPFLGVNATGVRNLPGGSFTNLQVTYE